MSDSVGVEIMAKDVEKNLPVASEISVPQSEEKKKEDAKKEEKLDEAAYKYRKSKKQAWGMFLVACAAVFGSIMSALVNVLSQQYKVPAPTITFTRSLFNLIINLICCAIAKVNPIGPYKEGRKFAWTVFRGLFGGIQITCYFFAFSTMPVGDSKVLTFVAPVLTGILAIWMLNEPWGWIDACGSVLCFIGVIIVSKPVWLFPDATSRLDPWGVFIATIGSIAAALAYISVRKAGPSVSIFVLINYILIFTMAINVFQGYYKLKMFPWPKPSVGGYAWFLIACCTVTGALAQVSINRGLQLEMAGPATSMRFLDIVLAYIWQVFFIKEGTDMYSIIGGTLVTICIFMISLKKYFVVKKAREEYEQLLHQQ